MMEEKSMDQPLAAIGTGAFIISNGESAEENPEGISKIVTKKLTGSL